MAASAAAATCPRHASPSSILLRSLETVVFAGGGVRGLGFVGALQALRDVRGIDFGARMPALRTVAGVSIGCAFAAMIALGYTVPEITEVAAALRYSDLLNIDPVRLLSGELSIDDGAKLRAWVGSLFARKGVSADITFAALRARCGMNVHMVVTDMSTASVVHIDAESHPHLAVTTAMTASMSLPLVFPAVTGPDGHQWVDGGVLENFPMLRFNPSTLLGFDFRWRMERRADTLLTYISRVMQTQQVPMEIASWALMSRAHRSRAVLIDAGTVTTLGNPAAGDLPADVRAALLDAGARAVHERLADWDSGNCAAATDAATNADPGASLASGTRTLPTYLASLTTCSPPEAALAPFRV